MKVFLTSGPLTLEVSVKCWLMPRERPVLQTSPVYYSVKREVESGTP